MYLIEAQWSLFSYWATNDISDLLREKKTMYILNNRDVLF